MEWYDYSNCFKDSDKPVLVTDKPDPEYPNFYTVLRLDNIKCRYYWEGDGTLEFILPDGKILRNTDCKKSNGWKLTSI